MPESPFNVETAGFIGSFLALIGTITLWFWRSFSVTWKIAQFHTEYKQDKIANDLAHSVMLERIKSLEETVGLHLENSIARARKNG